MNTLNELYDFHSALIKYRENVADSLPDRKTIQSLRTELQRTYARLQEAITQYSNEDPTRVDVWGQKYNVFESAFEPVGLLDYSEKLGHLDICIRITNKAIGKLEAEEKTWRVPNKTYERSENALKPKGQASRSGQPRAKKVFLVHGQDEAAKLTVARFLEHLDLNAIILHEQENRGRTIIEKLEGRSANVGFAVVLLTPDDVGAPKPDRDRLKLRARQNVIFELGFFVAALGRGNVCALHNGDVEIPSDYEGVTYIPMDPAGAWRMGLAKEIRAAGIDIDPGKLLQG